MDTRAHFDDTPAAEPWEKKIHTLTVYVFGDDNKILMFKRLTAQERSAMKGLLLLPESSAGTRCTVLAVANAALSHETLSTLDSFLSRSESDLYRYNNRSFSWVNTGRTPVDGFAMTGRTGITVGDANTASEAFVTLRRLTAKLAVRWWRYEHFAGPFFAVHPAYGRYEVGNDRQRYKGWLTGLGVSYGYTCLLSKRWNLTAEGGLGLYRMRDTRRFPEYDDWAPVCVTHYRRLVLAPSKLELSFSYLF